MFRACCYKKIAISFFVSEYPFLSLIVAKIRFLYVGNKIALLRFLYHKKSVFTFSLLKRVGFSYIAQITCFGLFAVVLGCFQCYCTNKKSSSSMRGVTLIFTRVYSNNGFAPFYIAKNSDFGFCLLNHVALPQRSVCPKVVLFPAFLHGQKVFFQFFSESPCFSLDFTQNNVFSCDWLSDNGLLVFGQVTLFSASSL